MMVCGSVVSREAFAGAASVLKRVPVTTTVSVPVSWAIAAEIFIAKPTTASAAQPNSRVFRRALEDVDIRPLFFGRKRPRGRKPTANCNSNSETQPNRRPARRAGFKVESGFHPDARPPFLRLLRAPPKSIEGKVAEFLDAIETRM